MPTVSSFPDLFIRYLANLVRDDNARLSSAWLDALKNLSLTYGPWVIQGLAGRTGPQITGLHLTLPCFAPLPLREFFHKAKRPSSRPPRLSLGRPGFWRTLLKLYQAHELCFEIYVQHGQMKARVYLVEPDRTDDKEGWESKA